MLVVQSAVKFKHRLEQEIIYRISECSLMNARCQSSEEKTPFRRSLVLSTAYVDKFHKNRVFYVLFVA